MPQTPITNSVIRQLQLVFSLSTLLLLISLVASYYSIEQLITSSRMVNHTNQVLAEAETIISSMKDAETGQRGYLVTRDPLFLQPYTSSKATVKERYERLRRLTADNPDQQPRLERVRALYEAKYTQMQRIIDLVRRDNSFGRDTLAQHREMIRGKQIMDELRTVISQLKNEENEMLQSRLKRQDVYIRFTPPLLIIAALISMLITAFTYVRIKSDTDNRLEQQRADAALYAETTRRISVMEGITQAIANGDYAVRSTDEGDDQLGRIARALNRMGNALEQTFSDLTARNWLQAGRVRLNDAIRNERTMATLAGHLIETLATYLNAPLGTVYLTDGKGAYALAGSYAAQDAPRIMRNGEGLLGQAIAGRKTLIVQHLPPTFSRLNSSLGSTPPTAVMLAPLVYADQCIGAIELGFLQAPDALVTEFMGTNLELMATSLNAALDYVRMQQLLEQTQVQAEELQTQHAELENLNTELEMQAQKLQASEEELRVQQEELQQTNVELEERGLLLETRNEEILKKADELELATRYKSEFLANMSHELRTPLNSILLLSRLLAENNEQNLTDDQVEYANVIRSSGNGLLGLIDEILDLSKIEAGQMPLDYQPLLTRDLTAELQGLFTLLAQEKGLTFTITMDPDVPTMISTDRMRLGQILKNLLSNALKFTATGSVTLAIGRVADASDRLSFAVTDTGIGIPAEKQALVFEAFQQADGSTRRKYGGTGLGLSISRELARLLGGDITLRSQVGEGSTFTLRVSVAEGAGPASVPRFVAVPSSSAQDMPPAAPEPQPADPYISTTIPEAIPDDRNNVTAQDKTILIVEDDTGFARALLDYARQKGYRGIVAVRGDEALELALTYRPVGILLDIQLPVMSGWDVMDALKANPKTRPIPVHMMSSHKLRHESRLKGAIDFVDKPMAFEQMQAVFRKIEYVLNRDAKKVLIIEDNPKHARALAQFLATFDIRSELKSNVSEGVDALKQKEIDCVILDMGVPDHKAYETLDEARKNPGLENLPIIVFTGKSLSLTEEMKIRKYADSIVVKTAHSYQRMLDEVSLFLHIVEENKPTTDSDGMARRLGAVGQVLANKTILVADDDVRNIFSLSKLLEQYKMTVIAALDGNDALRKLNDNPAVDAVLLDMMMPQMDGYETARKIREDHRWKNLPVIAVTAKAMTGDREKCIQAGASDYITKPVDIDQLISLLRVWLYERS